MLEDLALDDAEGLRAAGPRRHPRRVPAGRRPDAGAAALDAAGQLRGHLRRHRAVPAGADGRQLAQRVRRPQEQPQTGHPDPSRAGRGAGRDPRRHLRSDRLPGTGHGDRAARRRLLAGRGRPAAPGDGQEEEVRTGRPVREILRRAWPSAGTRRPRSRRCGTSCCRSPTTPSTRRIPRPTGMLSYWTAYLKANYPAEYMAALLTASATTRTRWPSTWPNAGRWASRCCRRTSTPRSADFAPVGTDIRFGLSAVRNVGTGVVASIVASRKDKGDYTDFYDFLEQGRRGRLQQEGRRVADQGRRLRLAGAPAQGPADGARPGDRRGARAEEGRGDRPVRPVRRDDARTRRAARSAAACRTPSGTPSSAWVSSGRCWACTCPGTRWPGSSTSCPPSRTRPSPTSWTAPCRTAAW